MRPQLIPEHEVECLSSPQVELLYEYMKEDQIIDPVKLDLCEYQAIEPVHSYHLVREDDDSIVEVSPHEALVINDASKIGAIDNLSNPEPQQDILTADQIPHPIPESQIKMDHLLIGPGKEVNLQDMDHWSVFTENLRYTVPETPAPGFNIQGQGCLDFSPEQVNCTDHARDVSMAPLEFPHMPASEYLDRYDDITSELNVNMECDDAVDVTTAYLGHESTKITDTFRPEQAYVKAKVPFIKTLLLYKGSLGTMKIKLVDSLTVMQIINNTPSTMYLSPEESLGIVDIRSLGYYNIKPQVMHFNLTGVHNLFPKWNLDLKLEEHFAKITTQNVCYQKREVVRKPPDLYP